jgi:hypothetical protein
MIPSTQSTLLEGQYFCTVDLQASTLRMPPASAGHFGDHFELDEPLVVVVAAGGFVVVGVAFVVVGEGALVVVVAAGAL